MGILVFDTRDIAVDDRALAHLQIVIIDKLRRNEKFSMSLPTDGHVVTMWMTSTMPLQFVYTGTPRPHVNRAWLEALADVVGMTGTLVLLPEPAEHPLVGAVGVH